MPPPKVAVVTGAARRGGIGRAIAARLLRDGMRVVVSDLERPMESHPEYASAQPTELQEAVAELGSGVGRHGVHVNPVCPGTGMTPLLDVPGGIFDRYPKLFGITREQYEHRLVRTIPVGRYETPEDVAAAVGFLASDDAAYITGT